MARFGRDMLIYASADLLGSSIGLVLSPLFTRLFTPAQYGAQAALAAVWSFASLAQYAGMDSAYPFFRARTSDEAMRLRIRVTATFVAVTAVLLVTAAFGAVSGATNWVTGFAEVSRREVLSYGLTLAPGAVMAWFLYLLRFEQRAAAFARVSLLGRVVGGAVVIPALALAAPADRLVLGFLITAAVTSIAAALGWRELARAGLPVFSPPAFDRSEASAMLRYGIVLVPASMMYALSTVLDRLLVTWFSGAAETAVLALALRLGSVAVMLRTWFALVWDPQLIDWIAKVPIPVVLDRLREAVAVIARLAAMLVCLAAIWAPPVVQLLYPPAYWAAVPLVPWIVFGTGVSALSLVAVAAVTIAKAPRLYLPVYGLGLAANLGVGWYCVPRLGAAGAVAGAVAGEICILGAWIFIGTRHLRNLPLPWWRWLLLMVATGGFLGLYRAGSLFPDGVVGERILISSLVIVVLGTPVARRMWKYRDQFFR